MAEAEANIKFTADTAQALASIKDLQRNISTLYRSMNTGAASAQAAQAGMQQNLVNSINSSGKFTARLTTIRTTTESFTNALEKNKLSLGQYFRFGVGATKNFGKVFTTEFNTIDKVARERVKDLQTQYIKMGRDASGAMKAIAVRPTTLDMTNLGTQTAIAAQKQQIFNQLLKQGTTNLLNFGKNTQWAGRQLMVGFTIPLGIFATQAARAFQNLEKQVIQFRRVYGDLFTTPQETEAALKDVRALALEFTKLGVAVEDTLGLAAKVAQMGNVGQDLIGQVTEATRLSVLGAMEQQDALDTTIGLTNAFGISIEDLTTKVDFLNAAENQTILSIQDFNEAVPRAGSVVRQLGGDVEDLAFFMTAMREGGIEATQAANALKSSLGRLINPTEAAAGRLRSMGIDIKAIVETNAGDLKQTVIDLAFALDTLDPLDKARAIEQLFGKFQFARMSAMFQNIVEEGSQANRVLELMGLTTEELATIADRELSRVEESSATKFTAALEKFRTELAPIGEEFLKMVTPIIEWATEMIANFNKLGEGGRAFVVGFLGVIGGLAPVLLMVIGLIANLIANIAKGVGLAFRFFQKLTGGSKNLAEQTGYLNSEQIESQTVAASLNQTHQTLTQTYTGEADALNGLAQAYRAAVQEMQAFNGPIMTAGGPMVSAPGFAKGRKVPGYRDGVVEVPGPKGAGDVMPAMLAPGEAVIPADMAKKYGSLINAMISGNIPGFMSGRNAPERAIGEMSQSFVSQSAAMTFINTEYQRILQLGGEELANEFILFVQRFVGQTEKSTVGALQGALNTITEETERFRLRAQEAAARAAQAPDVTAFAHTGTSAPMTATVASENLVDLGLNPEGAQAGQIKLIAQHIPEQVIVFLNALGLDIKRILNDQMHVDVAAGKMGASFRSFFDDVSNRGTEIFSTTLKLMGASGETHQAGLENFKQLFEQRMKSLLDKSDKSAEMMIVDTQADLEKIKEGLGDAFNPDNYVVLDTIFTQTMSDIEGLGDGIFELFTAAAQKIEEMRSNLGREGREIIAQSGDPAAERFLQGLGKRATGAPVNTLRAKVGKTQGDGGMPVAQDLSAQHIATIEASATMAAKKVVEKGTRAFGNALNQGAAIEGQTASPSKVTEQIGADHSKGFTQGTESGVDAARQVGEETAEAFQEGTQRGRKRGDPSRVRTAGETTTPGEELNFDILKGQVVETANQTKTFGDRTANAATKVVGMGNKIGMVGIGLSSLVGVLGRVEGPIGEFANKLFPVISALTGLSFALRMVNAETIKSLGTRIDESIAIASGARAKKAAAAQDVLDTKIARINTLAKEREAAASARLTLATNKQAAASIAATRGLTAMTTVSMFAGGGAPGRVAGNVAGGAVAVGSKASIAINNKLIAAQTGLLRMTVKLSKSFSTFGARFIKFFGRLGAGIFAVAKGVAAFLGPVGLVIAGLALLGGGIFLLIKAIKKNQDKINGLGDAASLSGKKLEVLNSALSANLSLERVGGVGGIGAGATGVGGLGEDESASARSIQADLLKSEEFKKEYEGIIAGLEGASVEAAERSLTSMALTLQSAGASDEMIAGIINALLESAGKTDVVIDFNSITIGEVAQSAQDAVDEYLENTKPSEITTATVASANAGFDDVTFQDRQEIYANPEPVGLIDDPEKRAEAAGLLASTIANASLAFAKGEIDAEEYSAAVGSVSSAFEIAAEKDPSLAVQLFRASLEQLKESVDLDSVMDEINSFLAMGDVESAGLIVEATAMSIPIDETQLQALKEGEEGVAKAIRDTIVAETEKQNVQKQNDERQEAAAAFQTELTEQNDAIRQQIDTYDEVSNAIANNSDIQDKNAFARKIAADETLRQEFALARQVDETNKNKDATNAFIAALTEQGELQAELSAQEAVTGLEDDIGTLEKQIETYDSAFAAASALVDETEARTIAQQIATDAALQDAFALAAVTDAATDTSEATDALIERLALRNQLQGDFAAKTEIPSRTRGGGGSKGPEGSFLDGITKRLKLFSNAQMSVTKGWEASIQAILDFANVAGNLDGSFNGLNKQLRGLDLNENLIEMITGMDPDEYEKRKHELFTFDDQGNITGMTEKLKGLNAALNTVIVGEFVNTQEQLANSVSNQVTAIDKLTAAGASYEAAYRAVQNTAFAAAIATAASSAQIKAAADAAMEAERMMKKMAARNEEEQRQKGISDAVKKMNKDFSNQAKILDYINRNRKTLRESQITELLNDQNLQALALEPSINPGALSEALDNAAKRADLELKIKKLTIEGQQGIFEEGMGKAMDAFNARSQKIEFDFEASIKNEKDIIKQAEEELALLNFELKTYEDGLKDIEFQEDEINKAYEKRFDALDRIAEANEEISRQQQAQLDVADALSRGDIAGAARAVREARAAAGEAAREQEQRRLERAQEAQLAALTSRDGLSRDQLEEKSLELEKQIFEIERSRINPAQELVRLAELKRDADIESLEVLGKTREEYEKMSNRIDIARAGNWKTVEAMQEALDIVETLVTELGKAKPPPPPPPAPRAAPAPARSSSPSRPAPAPAPTTYTVKPGDNLTKIAREQGAANWQAIYNANKGQIKDKNLIFPGQVFTIPGRATGGMIIPKRMAAGGPAFPVRRMAGGSMVKGYPLGGLIPYSSVGGPFPSLGSDTIPAMLTPGEFVIRRPAVREIGVDNLENLNRNASMGGDVYNYSVSVNVKSESDPDRIARTVIDQMKRIDSQRIRGNRY